MSSVSRRESRKILMRTAATALIAASPFVYSGASAATTGSAKLTVSTLHGGQTASNSPLSRLTVQDLLATNQFNLTAPLFRRGTEAGVLTTSNFQLTAPAIQGRQNTNWSRPKVQLVQNLIAVPMDAKAGVAAFSASTTLAITPAPGTTAVNNSDNLTVTDAETAIDVAGDPNHVVINNTGDLTGGGGISASTGTFDPNAGIVKHTEYNFVETVYCQTL